MFECRASSTSPSSQSSKMNSMLYQKQFQPSSAAMRMTQHFPGQFNPQVKHDHILSIGSYCFLEALTHDVSRLFSFVSLHSDPVSAQHRFSSGSSHSHQFFCWRSSAISYGPSYVTECERRSYASPSTAASSAHSAPS